MSTRFINTVNPDEVVISIAFMVEMTGNSAGFEWCFPYRSMLPIINLLNTRYINKPEGFVATKLAPVEAITHEQLSEAINGFDPEKLSYVLSQEHPQVVSLLLSYLPTEAAADQVSRMSGQLRNEVLLRSVFIDSPTDRACVYVLKGLEAWKEKLSHRSFRRIGGIPMTSEILKQLSTKNVRDIFKDFNGYDPSLVKQIKDLIGRRKP